MAVYILCKYNTISILFMEKSESNFYNGLFTFKTPLLLYINNEKEILFKYNTISILFMEFISHYLRAYLK